MKILIIEDDEKCAHSVAELLEAHKYSCEITHCVDEALPLIRTEPFFLILCDIFMPEKTGIDFLCQIKDINPALPIILITGHKDFNSAVKAINAGAVGFLLKPIDPTELIDKVDQLKKLYDERRDRDFALSHLVHEIHEMNFLTKTLLNKENQYAVVNYLVKQFTSILEDKGLKFKLAIAITELLQNSIEHGNLSVPSHLKEEYGSDGFMEFEKLIEERSKNPEFNLKKITITYFRSQTGVTLKIKDEGEGFNHQEKLDCINRGEIDIDKSCGRGLMIANSYMDEISYNKKGNEVTIKHLFKN